MELWLHEGMFHDWVMCLGPSGRESGQSGSRGLGAWGLAGGLISKGPVAICDHWLENHEEMICSPLNGKGHPWSFRGQEY